MNDRARSIDGITSLDASTFESIVLNGDGPIAVEFMSYSCAYCGALEPILQQAAELLRAKQQIFRVNIVVETDLARDFDIEATPTIVLFLGGTEIGRVEGPQPSLPTLLAELTQPFEA